MSQSSLKSHSFIQISTFDIQPKAVRTRGSRAFETRLIRGHGSKVKSAVDAKSSNFNRSYLTHLYRYQHALLSESNRTFGTRFIRGQRLKVKVTVVDDV